eukprot:1159017-Pelagomonas_calceolata.AAC.3
MAISFERTLVLKELVCSAAELCDVMTAHGPAGLLLTSARPCSFPIEALCLQHQQGQAHPITEAQEAVIFVLQSSFEKHVGHIDDLSTHFQNKSTAQRFTCKSLEGKFALERKEDCEVLGGGVTAGELCFAGSELTVRILLSGRRAAGPPMCGCWPTYVHEPPSAGTRREGRFLVNANWLVEHCAFWKQGCCPTCARAIQCKNKKGRAIFGQRKLGGVNGAY